MPEAPPIRVLIVDDHEMVRRGLIVFLQTFEDLIAVGEASNGDEALTLCQTVHPDVVLMDLLMPGVDGVTLTRLIREKWPTIQVLALSSYKDAALIQSVLQAGAIGYLMKNASIEDLANAIRAAYVGKPTLAPEVTQVLINTAIQPAPPDYKLSDREREVLTCLVKGLTNNQIAQQLNLSKSTVKFHVSSILSKLNVASRTEAVSLALHDHLVM